MYPDDCNADEEIPTQEELQKHMEQKVKEWALKKMAQQFNN